jgi:predicted short-subunit dehydrogenase-like oxidoreductase (DUF2520 family)
MRLTLVGPGRAGLAVALAASASGHDIVSVAARRPEAAAEAAARVGASAVAIGDRLPDTDLVVVAVKDDAIGEVAAALAASSGGIPAAVHLSGLATVDALRPLRDGGTAVGSFHPLQTLPTPEAGAARLAGAWIAITADPPLRTTLRGLAESIGARAFDLADDAKALYHAAAAAAANFPLAALAMAADLFAAADVPFEAARPLVEAVVANAFDLGPRSALTGPVARGDVGTVGSQIAAVVGASPEWDRAFRAFVRELASLTGRDGQFRNLYEGDAG